MRNSGYNPLLATSDEVKGEFVGFTEDVGHEMTVGNGPSSLDHPVAGSH